MIDPNGSVYFAGQGNTNYGRVRTSDEPTALFSDSFESFDTTNRWTSKVSTGTAAASAGALTVSSSTTASAYGGCYTQPTFAPKGINFLFGAVVCIFPVAVQANSARVVGFGTLPATPTIAVPVTDGVCFYLDGTGALFARIYASGVEVSSTALTAYNPTSGVPIGLAIQYRADGTSFLINSASNVVATVQITGPNVEQLPFFAISIAGATPPAASAQMQCRAMGVADSGKNNQTLVDSTYPWRGVNIDTLGALRVKNTQVASATYSGTHSVTVAATATDIFTLTGSATKTVALTKIILSGVQTTSGMADISVIKRSTADTGGTSTAGSIGAHDSTDAAATATLLGYTANPGALGTAVATIRRVYVPVPAPASIGTVPVVLEFGDNGKEGILRGVAQQIAVNLNGATLTGGVISVTFQWIEV